MTPKELKSMEKLFGKAVVDKPEKGFYTRKQLVAIWKLSDVIMCRKINLALKNNELERRMYRVVSGQVTRPIPHYRITK